MGLDSYLLKVSAEDVIDDFSFNEKKHADEKRDFAYWRKHRDLHQWMRRLFIRKGGDKKSDFNCQPIKLTLEDLIFLENDMFWNEENPECYFYEDNKKINEAKQYIEEGFAIYFYSWF